jgi:trigger factor
MEFKAKKTGGATAEITINNTSEEVEAAYQKAYEKAAASVKIPGFRKGKAPIAMVEKQLGDSVINDAARELIGESFEKIAGEIDPTPINVPKFDVQQFDRASGATFVGTYDIYPEVKLGKYKKVKVEVDSPSVSDETVDGEVEKLRQQQAILHPREDATAVDGDLVTIDLNILNGKKSLYKGNDIRFKVGEAGFPPEINERTKELKAGDSLEYETTVAEDFQDQKFAGKNIQVQMTVKQIQFTELPELNDEFAKDQGEYESLADLKKKIKEDLMKATENVLNDRAKEDALKAAAEDAKMDLPESMIESEFDQRIKQVRSRVGNDNLTLEQIAGLTGKTTDELGNEFMEIARQAVREKLVLREIADKEEIAVSDEEVDTEFDTRWSQYLSPEQLKDFKTNSGMRDDVKSRMLYIKVLDWILENAEKKKGKEITYEQLVQEGAFS